MAAVAANAALVLNPLATGPAAIGSGLTGTWYKVDDNAKFSNYVWEGEKIKDTGWGTGIWSISGDWAQITAANSPYVLGTANSTGAVRFANSIYNTTYLSGDYGVWAMDYVRPLAPIVGGNAQENYAASFTGYIYVGVAGLYDFGVFSDDGFAFTLAGGDGSLSMGLDSVAGSPGRVSYTLTDKNGLAEGLLLGQGYYSIDLRYFNRLEAGVIDLGWKREGDEWRSIEDDFLFAQTPAQVPEPATALLIGLGLLGIWAMRRGASARGRTTGLPQGC